jgi:hypothetical protein
MSDPSSALRFRQVHLDFHTHGAIKPIARRFTRAGFQAALRAGHVDSVTVFSKCHHGWSYHPTEVGRIHPGLDFDLLGEQIAAAHEIGVRAPIYISTGYDDVYLAERGGGDALVPLKAPPHPATEAGYRRICYNSPYVDYLCRQVDEVFARYDVDGLFFDITNVQSCYCRRCVPDMLARGLDPENPAQAKRFSVEMRERYFETVNAAARRHDPDVSIFHNSGHVSRGDRRTIAFNTHLELESLPTANWGYDHFPVSAKYAGTLPCDYLGMTGKFHTVWGEFGGFKHDNALRYECAAMQAYGARCSIGDQLHPEGEMNAETYRKIGLAYAEVEAREPWCVGARADADIAILSTEAAALGVRELDAHLADRNNAPDTGAARILLERQIMFEILDTEADFARYRLLILPDVIRLEARLADKLRAYLATGGKLILSGASGLDLEGRAFALPLGDYHGRTCTDMDFLNASRPLLALDTERRLVRCPFVINGDTHQVVPAPGAETLAELWHSAFNRTIAHFCGHQHAPEQRRSEFPGAFLNAEGNIAYIGAEIFAQYHHRGQMLYRDFVALVIERLLGDLGKVRAALPSGGRVSLMRQDAQKRHVLHLLYAVPMQRAEHAFPRWGIHKTQVIEDIVPLFDVACSVRIDRAVARVRLAPSGDVLPHSVSNGWIRFTVPRVECHQMIELVHAQN